MPKLHIIVYQIRQAGKRHPTTNNRSPTQVQVHTEKIPHKTFLTIMLRRKHMTTDSSPTWMYWSLRAINS